MSELFESRVVSWPWRPLYWEPVTGTGERLMVGVVYYFNDDFRAVRTIRKDVLECLFGKAGSGLLALIDESVRMSQAIVEETRDIENFPSQVFGVIAGDFRVTAASSSVEILETACLLYSSLASLDKLDEVDENDAPQNEEVNRRFGTEVRSIVVKTRPDLASGFGASAQLIENGQNVKFGFSSRKAIIHFMVLSPVRYNASLKDARAKIFELQRAKQLASIPQGALIAATPRLDDPTLGGKQRDQLRSNQSEIEREADVVGMRWFPAHSAEEGAARVISLAG